MRIRRRREIRSWAGIKKRRGLRAKNANRAACRLRRTAVPRSRRTVRLNGGRLQESGHTPWVHSLVFLCSIGEAGPERPSSFCKKGTLHSVARPFSPKAGPASVCCARHLDLGAASLRASTGPAVPIRAWVRFAAFRMSKISGGPMPDREFVLQKRYCAHPGGPVAPRRRHDVR